MNIPKINEYQVAELYHQLMMTVATKFLPKIITRRLVDTPDVPGNFVEGPDEINNIILYDEILLYIYEEEKLCKAYWGKFSGPEHRLIAKYRDLRVYYDEEIQMFIMVPHVSSRTRRMIRRITKKDANIEIRHLETLAFNFCSQLRKAYNKIADRYVRDMAVYSVERVATKDIVDAIVDLNILVDVDRAVKAVHDYYWFTKDTDRIKAIHTRKWTHDQFLFNRALMVYYRAIMEAGSLPHGTNLIDPINYVVLKGCDDVQWAYNNYNNDDTLIVSSLCSVKIDGEKTSWTSDIGFLRFNWNHFVDRSDMKILSNQFKINHLLSNTLPAQIIALIECWRDALDSSAFKSVVDNVTNLINGKLKTTINEKIILRVSQYQNDDCPRQYECQKYIRLMKR